MDLSDEQRCRGTEMVSPHRMVVVYDDISVVSK